MTKFVLVSMDYSDYQNDATPISIFYTLDDAKDHGQSLLFKGTLEWYHDEGMGKWTDSVDTRRWYGHIKDANEFPPYIIYELPVNPPLKVYDD